MALEGYVFPDLQGIKLSLVIKRTVTDFIDDELPTYSSALAFQLFFSLFSFLLFLVALIGVLDLQPFFDWPRQQAALVMPPMAMELIDSVIEQLQTQEIGLFSLSILLALWTASAAVRSVMDATNKVYGIKEGRPVWKRFALSLFFTVVIAAALLLAAGFMVLGPQLLNWLAQYLGIEQLAIQLWTWLRWPLVVALLMLAVAVVYYAAPDVQPAFRIITPGSVLSVVVWISASLGFAYYTQNFATYNATYGSIGCDHCLLVVPVYLFGCVVVRCRVECGDRAYFQ
jgi:membrane protein